MAKLSRKKVLRVAVETTAGTATTADQEVLAYDPIMQPTAPFEERKPGAPYMGHYVGGIVGELIGTCSFRTELRETSTGTAIDLGLAVLMQGCGWKLDTGVWKPQGSTITNQSTVTIDLFEDGLKKRLYGAMGNVSFEGTTGKRIFANWDFVGKWAAPTDVALPTPTHTAAAPAVLRSATLTLGTATALKISSISINMGNQIEPREDITDSTGILHYMIVDRDISVTMDPEVQALATYDPYALWLAGTTGALVFKAGTSADTDAFAFAAPAVQHRNPSVGDRGGKLIDQLTGQCNASSGDDEITLTVS